MLLIQTRRSFFDGRNIATKASIEVVNFVQDSQNVIKDLFQSDEIEDHIDLTKD